MTGQVIHTIQNVPDVIGFWVREEAVLRFQNHCEKASKSHPWEKWMNLLKWTEEMTTPLS